MIRKTIELNTVLGARTKNGDDKWKMWIGITQDSIFLRSMCFEELYCCLRLCCLNWTERNLSVQKSHKDSFLLDNTVYKWVLLHAYPDLEQSKKTKWKFGSDYGPLSPKDITKDISSFGVSMVRRSKILDQSCLDILKGNWSEFSIIKLDAKRSKQTQIMLFFWNRHKFLIEASVLLLIYVFKVQKT